MRPLPLVLLAALLAAPAARAEPTTGLREFTSARGLGKAGASIGFAGDTDALHANPAAISFFPHFNLSLGGLINAPQRSYVFSVEAVDSKINQDEAVPVSGGLGYLYYVTGEGFEARKGHVVNFALSVPLYADLAFVGVTARYLKISGAYVTNAVTMDAAVMVKLAEVIGISAVGYNLIPINSLEARRAWGFGVAVGKETAFHVSLDARLDQNDQGEVKPTFAIGGEYLIADLVAPRLGYVEDMLRGTHNVAAGVSLQYQGFALDLGYRQAIGGDEKTVAIALRMLEF